MVTNTKPTMTRSEERLVQWDLEFRPNVKVAETLDFVRQDGARLYIDVDNQDIPIAIEFVHPESQPDDYVAVEHGDDDKALAICMKLFAWASQMVTMERMAKGARVWMFTDQRADQNAGIFLVEPSRRMMNRMIRQIQHSGGNAACYA